MALFGVRVLLHILRIVARVVLLVARMCSCTLWVMRVLGRRPWVAAFVASVALPWLLVGCVSLMTEPPRSPENSCGIFMERPEWYRHAREAEQRWGVPIPVQLSIIYQESTFRPQARPPRGRILGVIPGGRPSTAYGYGQVIDATWRAYQRGPGGPGASRDDFGDVVHFIGWYGQSLLQDVGIAMEDPRQFYLAYHEGPAGFKRATYRGKPRIEQAAANVAARARRYASQLGSCRADLDAQLEGSGWWPF